MTPAKRCGPRKQSKDALKLRRSFDSAAFSERLFFRGQGQQLVRACLLRAEGKSRSR
jgi:hypothetical protein